MCDVMPTISEDSISQRSSQFGDDANFEQLMVSMLDERDKLVESLKNEQEKTSELEQKVKELEKERQSLNRQLNQNLPQVIILKRKEYSPCPPKFPLPHFCTWTHAPSFPNMEGGGKLSFFRTNFRKSSSLLIGAAAISWKHHPLHFPHPPFRDGVACKIKGKENNLTKSRKNYSGKKLLKEKALSPLLKTKTSCLLFRCQS